MARSSDVLNLVLLAGVGYLVYQNWPAISAAFGGTATGAGAASIQCKFPDGSTIAMPAGNSCPFDASHGGQSTPCYPAAFVGPLQPGQARC